jgi:hypothetical protein
MDKKILAVGLLIVGIDAVLLLTNVIESGVAAMIGIMGIGLIAAAGRSNIKKDQLNKSASGGRKRAGSKAPSVRWTSTTRFARAHVPQILWI